MGAQFAHMSEAAENVPAQPAESSIIDTRYWHALDDGRVQCDVCPRACKLRDGQRGLCFVRGAEAGRIKLFSYGRSSGFASTQSRKSLSTISCPERACSPSVQPAAI
jgi:hypothetical protein